MSANAGCAEAHVAIVNDTAFEKCRGIYVGVGGDVSIVCNGQTVLYKNAASGSVIPVAATKVNASGTTATDLVALQG